MGVAYGIKVSGMDNEYVQITHMAMSSLTLTKRPGIFWVDYFPFLRHVPAWVPGATGRKLSNFAKPLVYAMRDRPYAAVKSDYLNGTAEPSIARMMMEALDAGYSDNMDLYSEQEQIKKDALGVAYAGGFETSSSATLVFFLAMAMYPDVQKKAQAELDRVIGEGRLPSFEDYQSLPYIQAVILEILRWMPVVPMGVVHRVMVEDEYKGYRIPKGALMIPNVWAMAHDPKDYPCPEQFNPERFITDGTLDTNVRDPSTIAFGFGRRVCPGRHLAKDTLFLTIASTLYVYDIEAALDEERKPYALRAEQTTAFLSQVFLFYYCREWY
ncbi:hypothetical protein EW026_g988 [Hermanssonia centrifuga]|uniref:Cytochrome P450 n=1 Tax=Hermanssonia centrifuga TaxID=98765 RepID=A0A4S4KTG0_9APHY|nr:hypothetical protein EW026_g988 [Hermanssonia centrifuga]